MLTSELVRYRINGDRVQPRYILRNRASRYLADCRHLVQLIEDHIGSPQKDLFLALTEYEGERTDFKIIRGLCKLLLDNAEFGPAHSMDYIRFREQVFTLVQEHYPVLTHKDLIHPKTRPDVLAELAVHLNLTPDEMMERLYGDLQENQILTSCDRSVDEAALIKRYNLALAQGLLYRAQRMVIRLRSDYRQVFQYIKLAGLMHWIRPLEAGGYEIVINGPGQSSQPNPALRHSYGRFSSGSDTGQRLGHVRGNQSLKGNQNFLSE